MKYYDIPKTTIWGRAQQTYHITDGIIEYATASHGGFWVHPDLYATMPDNLKAVSFTGDNWFEEDASWCAVVLHWPQYFNQARIYAAQKTYDVFYAEEYGPLKQKVEA